MNTNLTEIVYILDRSGSMAGFEEAAVSGFNTMLREQQSTVGDALLTLHLFDDAHHRLIDRQPIQSVRPITQADFEPRGMTALYDAIGSTIDSLGHTLHLTPEHERPGHVVITTFTDGLENASIKYSQSHLRELISHQRTKYSWEFLFLAADEEALLTASDIGVDQSSTAAVAKSSYGITNSARAWSNSVQESRQALAQYGSVSLDEKSALQELYEQYPS